MDIVPVAIPYGFGGIMAAMSIKKKDPGLVISIPLREEYLMQPSQASVIRSPPILGSGEVISLADDQAAGSAASSRND